MRIQLEENKGVPASLLWTLAIIAGVSVANLYYNQPLLNRISEDLHVSEFTANLIPMVTQIGYAAGLLFIIPLGDLYKRRNIIVICFLLLSVSLFGIAVARNIHFILLASLITGICSVMPQIFIPIAAQFSRPERKAQNVGLLISGLLTGILGSRVVSGIVGEYWGWRTIFYIASALMLVCIFVILRLLPDMPSNFRGTYLDLMKSVFTLVRRNATLRLVSFRAGLCFGCFLTLWACLAFKLSGAPFYAGNNIIGMLGLCGIAGALTAIRPPLRSKEFQLHRMRHHDTGMVCPLFLSKQLCRHRCRNHFDRHRYAMHPNKQSDLCLVFRASCLEPGEHHFYDYLFHRRSFRDISCRDRLAPCWMGRSGFSRHCSCRHFFAYYAFR